MSNHKPQSAPSDTIVSEQLEALFNNATLGIVIINQKGEIINFNQHAEKQFGYSKQEITGRPVEILIPHQFKDRHETYRDSFYQNPHTRMMGAGRDLYARRKDNTEFPVEVSLSPYQANDEYFVIAFVVDITVRKSYEIALLRQKEELEKSKGELEKSAVQIHEMNADLERQVEERTAMLQQTLRELEQSREELRTALEKEKELSALKSRFVSMASHEFRTPLSTILSSANLAQKYRAPEVEEKREKHLLRIQEAVRNLNFILEGFLSLGKLEEGLVQAKQEELTPDNLFSELENIIQEMMQISKREQHLQFTHDFNRNVTVDKKLLHYILVNLISNAIKYSPENSVIKVGCAMENACLKIWVSDQGIGIPEEDQKHLFERFFRAQNASAVQGTGLGLHIVARYLQLMNGRIEMKSGANEGTTFTFYIPQQQN